MMHHVSEEQFVLHYYGEAVDAGIENHLAGCPECREEFRKLQQVLNVIDMPVPDRGAEYEHDVWNRLTPRLGVKRAFSWWAPRRWAAVAAMSALVAVAFIAGRYSPHSETPAAVATQQSPVRERVLVVAVGNHLERSQMVLVELVNSPDKGKVDIGNEQALAEDLLSENRLYRQTASAAGETGVASLLEDLERVLIEIAHSPGKISSEELDDIRHRIESQGLLFKMRVMGSNLNERVAKPARSEGGKQL
jgi:hypothetical protein